MLGGVAVAVAAMEVALLRNDFSLEYVANNSTRSTPLLYNMATLWGALEGSILLWGFILVGYVSAATWSFRRRLDDRLMGFAMFTMFVVCAFFFMLLVGPAHPFGRLAEAPADGAGLNPLLRNHSATSGLPCRSRSPLPRWRQDVSARAGSLPREPGP